MRRGRLPTASASAVLGRRVHHGLVSMSSDRSNQYANGTTALQNNVTVAGADGVFDLALTNGLLAVVAATITGHPAAMAIGRAPAANSLLMDLVATFGKDSAGFVKVPTGENAVDFDGKGLVDLGYERMVSVNVDLLLDALGRTQAARHGRGPAGLLTIADVDALAALDEHPALSVLSDYRRELFWELGSVADSAEFDRALGVLELLSDDDVAARVAACQSTHGYGSEEHELQFCPVCGHQTLVATGSDAWGYGIVPARCPVCSFEQSEHSAELLNLDQEWESRWAD